MSLDERVTALEQGAREFQRDFLVHLSENNRHMATLNKVITQQEINSRDVDHNLGMLLGMVAGQEKSIKSMESAIKDIREDVDLRFDVVDRRLDSVDKRLDSVDKRLDSVDKRFDGVDRRLDSMDQKFDKMLQLLTSIISKLGIE